MGIQDNQPYNPDYKSDMPIAQPTSYSHNTYARLNDEQVARNLHNNINNGFSDVPLAEQQVIIVDNRSGADDAVVTGCLAGSIASILCCTIM